MFRTGSNNNNFLKPCIQCTLKCHWPQWSANTICTSLRSFLSMTFQCTLNTRLKKIVVVVAKSKQYSPLLLSLMSISRNCFMKSESKLDFYSTYTYASCQFECKIKVVLQYHCQLTNNHFSKGCQGRTELYSLVPASVAWYIQHSLWSLANKRVSWSYWGSKLSKIYWRIRNLH